MKNVVVEVTAAETTATGAALAAAAGGDPRHLALVKEREGLAETPELILGEAQLLGTWGVTHANVSGTG